ncbi:unnamed protein product [Phytophthora fragariaefolia]|uniref:Unnamed protein product n=1 Tax=Phytophthora fragariaefolia TaxID=1490495 RepID=A0A9W7CYU7_9STRA|nr:unnamed protein product [Phytophthora fragariaefolia]
MTVTLADGETEEQYELLSFPEDPGINHVCTFRHEDSEGFAGGYSVHKTGEIHQKLLVQRLLDDTEKDRIKDKHAKSVLASKSRSSKLIDSELEKPTKRQRLVTRLSSVPRSKTSAGNSAWSNAADRKRYVAQEAKENIEKGFEVEVEEPSQVQTEKDARYDQEEGEDEKPVTVVVSEETAAAARDAEFHELFSSDSDDEAGQTRVLRRSRKKAAKEVENGKKSVIVEIDPSDSTDTGAPKRTETTETKVGNTAQAKAINSATAKASKEIPAQPTAEHEAVSAHSKLSGDRVDIYALKPIKPSSSGVEVKRARVRSALVSDRVKQSRMPNLSFFPPAIVQICQRLANYRGRSVILDESDYDSFVETHEQFRQDWETLDKVSLEYVLVKFWLYLLDKSTIHVYARWGVAAGLLVLYLVRVFYLNAFHIVTYGLGIYLLNLFIGFLSPQVDMETEGPLLPHKQSEEFRPFTRRVPEFQFWYSTFKAAIVSLLMTLSSAFDVPVFWPILLIYFIVLFALTMKRQIKHMWKHNYVPWDHGKQVYKGKKNAK